jgi:hypothetical protein
MSQDVMGTDGMTRVVPAYVQGFVDEAALSGLDATQADADDAMNVGEIRFADKLLTALVNMAVRSKRRQADLCAAMCRSGLQADQAQMTDALRELEAEGLIEHIVPLYDGGVLLSVTSRGIEKRGNGPRWALLSGANVLRV